MIDEPQRSQAISSKVFVGNLNFKTTQEELSELLGAAGEVVDVYLPVDRATGRPRGFAFVEFGSEEEAEEAIRKFNEHEFDGRRLNVNAADDRPRRNEGGPRSFGGPSGGGGFDGGGGGGGGGRPFKPKGSRRGKRAQKRSL